MKQLSGKTKTKLLVSALLIAASLLMMFFVSRFPRVFFPWYRSFSSFLLKVVSAVTGLVPFSVWDVLVPFLAVGLIFLLFRKKIADVLLIVSAVFSFALFGWLLNHYAPPLAESFDLTIEPTSRVELLEATLYYYDKASEYSVLVDRDDYDFYELAKITGASYKGLNGFPDGSSAPVKRFTLIGEYLMYNGIIGMFMPVTAEASVPASVPKIARVFSMAHEAAHRLGIASEQEANFAAFIACSSSDDVRLNYSGYYEAFNYCLNSLYRVAPELAAAINTTRPGNELLMSDRREENEIYRKYESPMQDVSDKINDTYLKTFGQEAGIMSYGMVTDYLIAYYKSLI